MYNPENFKPDPVTGKKIAQPPHPGPSLAALVEAGELRHADLVLPAVPHTREATLHWMHWAKEQDDVWFMSGNSEYADFSPSGEQPEHINIWFEESAIDDIQQLIEELEALPDDGT